METEEEEILGQKVITNSYGCYDWTTTDNIHSPMRVQIFHDPFWRYEQEHAKRQTTQSS